MNHVHVGVARSLKSAANKLVVIKIVVEILDSR